MSRECLLCQAGATTVIELMHFEDKSAIKIKHFLKELCVSVQVYSKRMCIRLVDVMSPIILYAIQHQPNLTAYDICAVLLQAKNCGVPKGSQFLFSVDIDGEFPIHHVRILKL